MARQKGSRTGRCQGCNHLERLRIERLLAAGAPVKATARKFEIDYHALRRHWINHVSAEARAAYIVGAGATKDQLETVVADESLALIDHYRIVRGTLYKGLSAASELNMVPPVAAQGVIIDGEFSCGGEPRCRAIYDLKTYASNSIGQ